LVSSTARRGASSSAPKVPHPEAVLAASQAASAQIVESMLHDTRNPLNALAINLEVLTEKLKDDQGRVPPALDKNLRAMREQVFRVDAILRSFAEFLLTQPNLLTELSLAQVLERAQEVLGHEARKRRIKFVTDLEPGLNARLDDPLALRFLAYQGLLRALQRSEPGSEVSIAFQRQDERAVLRIQDSGGEAEVESLVREALEALGRANAVEVTIHGGRCELAFPVGDGNKSGR
jgi:signal transduction histidine kinase